MTNQDLLIQLLCEATGESKVSVRLNVLLVIRAMDNEKAGSTAAFHKEFSADEARIILDDMRQRKDQIVEWFNRQVQRLEAS